MIAGSVPQPQPNHKPTAVSPTVIHIYSLKFKESTTASSRWTVDWLVGAGVWPHQTYSSHPGPSFCMYTCRLMVSPVAGIQYIQFGHCLAYHRHHQQQHLLEGSRSSHEGGGEEQIFWRHPSYLPCICLRAACLFDKYI